MTADDTELPFADDDERDLARARLEAMDAMLRDWRRSRSLPSLTARAASPAAEPRSYERWEAGSAADVAEVHRLAQQPGLSDDGLRRASGLAERALAAGMAAPVEEVRYIVAGMARDAVTTQLRVSDPQERDKVLLRRFDRELSDVMTPGYEARLAAAAQTAREYQDVRLAGGMELPPATFRAAWASTIAQVHSVAEQDGASAAEVAWALGLAQQAFQAWHGERTAWFYGVLKNKDFAARYWPEGADPQTIAEVESWPKPPAWARPLPNALDLAAAEKVRRSGPRWHLSAGCPSPSWWQAGALVADDKGAGLIDADGVRRPFPFQTGGCMLVRGTAKAARPDDSRSGWTALFVAAPAAFGKQALLRLPGNGFYSDYGQVDAGKAAEVSRGLRGFAARAGMEFTDRWYDDDPRTTTPASPDAEFPGYTGTPSWEDAIYDQAWRARRVSQLGRRLGSVLGHRKPEWQDVLGSPEPGA